ncbi:uncharacterized protein BT62DRAFT_97334 [Guyanagaster necrorhizus]|uniref:Uncharacterized protein n=1 Tax=Guyanagaster necrorhizus TaxID=856835 RepID=A0A9P7VVN8_9AGAR|nr:uncharacterized protein BT62DRAFT_97334 [Guyanagaster necrorhizus MCA 3950]KAG7447014.1 hypothetical protein BT62DRAFT_97334 [Guyanagaster necrorhizus MCA 3950]
MSFRETSAKSKIPPPPAPALTITSELPPLPTWIERQSNLPPSGPRAAKRNRQVSTSGDVFDDLSSTSPSSRAHPPPASGYGRESRDNAVENAGNPLPKGPRALRPPTSESTAQGWIRERSPPSMFGAEGHMRGFEDQSRGSMYPHPMERGQGRPPRGRGEFSRPTLSGTNSLPLGSRKSLGGPLPSSSGGDAPPSSGKFMDSRLPDGNSGGLPMRKPRNAPGPSDSRMHVEVEVNPRHRVSDNGYPHRLRNEEPRISPQEPPPNLQRYGQEHPSLSFERRGGERNRDEPPRQYPRQDNFSTSPNDEHRPATPPPLSRDPSQSHSWEGSRGSVRYDKEREGGRRERFRGRDDRGLPPPAPPLEEPVRNDVERERERPVSPSTSRLPPGHGLPNKPEGLPPRPRRDDMDVDDGRYLRDGFEERPLLRRGEIEMSSWTQPTMIRRRDEETTSQGEVVVVR